MENNGSVNIPVNITITDDEIIEKARRRVAKRLHAEFSEENEATSRMMDRLEKKLDSAAYSYLGSTWFQNRMKDYFNDQVRRELEHVFWHHGDDAAKYIPRDKYTISYLLDKYLARMQTYQAVASFLESEYVRDRIIDVVADKLAKNTRLTKPYKEITKRMLEMMSDEDGGEE